MTRPINKDYYFIDFHATIDAIKYRVYYLTEKVKELYKPTNEKKDFFCPQCQAQWTQLEVVDKWGPMGFECHRCGAVLEREERQEGDATGHEKQSKLMSQLEGLIKMLQQIDSQDIPNNDFDAALALAVPVKRDSTVNPLRPYQPANNKNTQSSTNKVTTVVMPLDVSVTTGSERTAMEQVEEAKRKADTAAQNILPVWHTTSTVTGETTASVKKEGTSLVNGTSLVRDEGEEKNDSIVLNDELSAYYAQLAQEKEKEAREDREADESSGDDEDFEDVDVGQSSADAPLGAHPIINGANGAELEQSGKISETESSAPATDPSTPANGDVNAHAGAEGPALKRVKFEDATKYSVNGSVATGNLADNDSDEDDEVEFEDV